MRLVTWNCGGGFHRKTSALGGLAPDIAIVQECADLELLNLKAADFTPTSALWTGDNRHKGLGVFSFGRYQLERFGANHRAITYALAARVTGPLSFNLLALWSHHGKLPVRVAAPGPTLRAFRAYAGFLQERFGVAAGDLNNHVRWDRPRKASNHANTIRAAAALGLTSAYHAFHRLAQGAEKHPTLYWRDRARDGLTYHIDYVFVPCNAIAGLRRVTVGSYAKWVGAGLSDHVPIVIDLNASVGLSET